MMKKDTWNIGLSDYFLSPFGLLFEVLQYLDSNIDQKIAVHIIHVQMFRPIGPAAITTTQNNDSDNEFDGDD